MLRRLGYKINPLKDGSLAGYTLYEVPMTSLTLAACEPLGVKPTCCGKVKELLCARTHQLDVHQTK